MTENRDNGGAFIYGGKLVLVPYWVSRSPEEFYQLLMEEQVTILNQTPSAFRQLIQTEQDRDSSQLPALRLVTFGGEAPELSSLHPWLNRHGDLRPQLINMYGITETTVHVTLRPLSQADLENGQRSVIGGPIPDLQCYVLDSRQCLLPIGIPGELYVGGSGLARGYFQRAELTAERFVPHPFSSEPGARLYRTGDLVHYLASGELEYLGRIDQQVKLHGFRIELGEIEAVLQRHPQIKTAIVSTKEDSAAEKRLVVYIVSKEETKVTVSDALPQQNLPPSVFSPLFSPVLR